MVSYNKLSRVIAIASDSIVSHRQGFLQPASNANSLLWWLLIIALNFQAFDF